MQVSDGLKTTKKDLCLLHAYDRIWRLFHSCFRWLLGLTNDCTNSLSFGAPERVEFSSWLGRLPFNGCS